MRLATLRSLRSGVFVPRNDIKNKTPDSSLKGELSEAKSAGVSTCLPAGRSSISDFRFLIDD